MRKKSENRLGTLRYKVTVLRNRVNRVNIEKNISPKSGFCGEKKLNKSSCFLREKSCSFEDKVRFSQ